MSAIPPEKARPGPRHWLLLALCAGLAVPAVARIAGEWRAGTAWRDAQEAAARRDFAGALARAEACLARWPDSGEATLAAARYARRSGDARRARELLRRAGELGWVAEAVELEATIQAFAAGDSARAERYLLNGVAANHPESPDILEAMATAYHARFRLDRAAHLARKWVELEPESADAHLLLGRVLDQSRDTGAARDALGRAAALAPGRADTRLAFAGLLLQINQAAEARPHLESVLALDPASRDARYGLARCERIAGDTASALARLDALLAENPADAEAQAERGQLRLDQGEFAAAVADFRAAVARPPYTNRVLAGYAVALEGAGDKDEAERVRRMQAQADADLTRLRDVSRLIVVKPEDPDLRREAGELLLRNHMTAEGLRWLDSALAIDPRHKPSLQTLADYWRERNPALATEYRRQADAP